MNRQLPKQRGAALLSAMLTVAIVATFAATALWQQWGSIEVERAERQRLQVAWMLTGALDWSRLILREDARSSTVDHLGEPWALVLEESRLSTFLAADRTNTAGFALEDTLDAFLSGQVQDAQAYLNINNLIDNNQISAPHKAVFLKLFETLGLPPAELNRLCDALLAAHTAQPGTDAFAKAPLRPQRVDQLLWLGLSPATLARLRSFVTVLPQPTTVNINTAPLEVLVASIGGADMALASRALRQRAASPFQSLEAASTALGLAANQLTPQMHSITTQYFLVAGRMRLEETTIQELSLIERIGRSTKTVWRERGVLAPKSANPSIQ